MVEYLKCCQKLYENVYFVPLQETLKVKMDRNIKCSITVSCDAGGI